MNWNQRAHSSQLSPPLAFKRAPAHRSPCSPWPANSPHRARSRLREDHVVHGRGLRIAEQGAVAIRHQAHRDLILVDLLDEAVERMHKGMVARNEEAAAAKAEAAAAADGEAAAALPTGGGLSDDEMKAAARVLGYGAVKYADLKGNRNSNYIFSFDRMLDPRGDTAVYLLYAGARLCGILRKAGADGDADERDAPDAEHSCNRPVEDETREENHADAGERGHNEVPVRRRGLPERRHARCVD